VIAEFTGGFEQGVQIQNGIKAYTKHGDHRREAVELIVRDTKCSAPETAKKFAEELIANDKVDFLAGFGMTPNAMAVAPVATQAKKPMIIMNAATSVITTKSPYIVRFSMTLPQETEPMALWTAKNGIKKVVTIVTDYPPGIDSETTFVKSFTGRGGTVLASMRAPLMNPDFAPLVQKAKDAKPDAVFIFVPGGGQAASFMKVFKERGLREAGIKLVGPGDITDDAVLEAMGDTSLRDHHHSTSPAHESAENAAFKKATPSERPACGPNLTVAGYDGMAAIHAVAQAGRGTDGTSDGPLSTRPQARVTSRSIRHAGHRAERLRPPRREGRGDAYNVEFDRYPHFKDPGSRLPGPRRSVRKKSDAGLHWLRPDGASRGLVRRASTAGRSSADASSSRACRPKPPGRERIVVRSVDEEQGAATVQRGESRRAAG
jgi:branched-chain amino acid transport system substrate-binding protein